MKVIINGETINVAQDTNLKKLLVNLELDEKVMAAAINMEIIKQSNWDNHILKDGDKLELLDFVGGG
jgi:sulfur carrier protein